MTDPLTRIYVIHSRPAKLSAQSAYLVRATNRSQAIRHVAEQTLTCEVASQDTLVELIGEGVKVDNAKATQEEIP
jgi:hypothetical protein